MITELKMPEDDDTPEVLYVAADGTPRSSKGQFLPRELRKEVKDYAMGKGGRKPLIRKTAKERLKLLAHDEKMFAAIKKVIRDPDHPQWAKMVDFVARYGIGVPKQTVEHEGIPSPVVFALPNNRREAAPEPLYVEEEAEVIQLPITEPQEESYSPEDTDDVS